jgi:hypothetical protein
VITRRQWLQSRDLWFVKDENNQPVPVHPWIRAVHPRQELLSWLAAVSVGNCSYYEVAQAANRDDVPNVWRDIRALADLLGLTLDRQPGRPPTAAHPETDQ